MSWQVCLGKCLCLREIVLTPTLLWFEGPFQYHAWERTEVDVEEEEAEDEEGAADEDEVDATGDEDVSNESSQLFLTLCFTHSLHIHSEPLKNVAVYFWL